MLPLYAKLSQPTVLPQCQETLCWLQPFTSSMLTGGRRLGPPPSPAGAQAGRPGRAQPAARPASAALAALAGAAFVSWWQLPAGTCVQQPGKRAGMHCGWLGSMPAVAAPTAQACIYEQMIPFHSFIRPVPPHSLPCIPVTAPKMRVRVRACVCACGCVSTTVQLPPCSAQKHATMRSYTAAASTAGQPVLSPGQLWQHLWGALQRAIVEDSCRPL